MRLSIGMRNFHLSILGSSWLAFALVGTSALSVVGESQSKPQQAGVDCRVESSSVALPDLPEASGLAASRRTPGTLWSHEDSAHVPTLFALDSRGSLKGKVRVSGVTLADWEDVALGKCAASSCLYAADIGDNRGARRGITVYRIPEPLPSDSTTGTAEAFHGIFPDGAQDAEALFVLGTGMFVVTKGATGPVALYRFPSTAKAGPHSSTLEKIGVIQGGSVKKGAWVTGASASPDGRWVVLRTHGAVAFYDATRMIKGDFGSPLKFDLAGLHEPQGEGIAFGAKKGSVFLVGEGGGKGGPGTFASLVCELPGP